ncbi:MAG: type II secretion system GspH family protein [Deltaproteobacteria bacterium]|jgi:general secretion pathway protein G|nr:type II secretion system GspH family protein [Deltaproteobacteria bacterium]MCW8894137.1 type II secretion system GspH family protein [Deltaproteobacteria bacterium]MCW9048928.1 type II secretion system GspH family protein [Deltaproteobacteria bacterium]
MQNLYTKKTAGMTLIELVIAMAILAILAAMVIPLAEVTVTRTKELELRRALRTIRTAIDGYKEDYDKAVAEKKIFATVGESGYPEELEKLLEGNDWSGLYPFKKKYLRRIPGDPFDKDDNGWGLRAYSDDADSTVWGGEDVYDVYSQSEDIALDGTTYRDW